MGNYIYIYNIFPLSMTRETNSLFAANKMEHAHGPKFNLAL